ncbi:PspC domain-containing protein [Nesterenkonia suensis]
MDDSTPLPDEGAPPRRDAPGRRPEAGHQFFDWVRSTGLRRPSHGWFGGVLALLAEKLRWDPALVRGLGVVAVVLFFSPTILLYGLAWILVPDRRGRIPLQQALRGDFTAGLFGGAALAVVGALNVATPLSIVGPFAVLVNLLVIGVVAWIVVIMVRDHRRRAAATAAASESSPETSRAADQQARREARHARRETRQQARQARHEAWEAHREADQETHQEAPGKAQAGSSSSVRDDGRPAWYPRHTADSPDAPDPGTPYGGNTTGTSTSCSAAVRSPHERDQARRRRMISFGLLLAAASGVLLAVAVLGLSGTSAVLVGLIGLVTVLALLHMAAALRGRQGRGLLLTLATAAMLLTFFLHQNPGSSPDVSGSNVAFGQYTSQEDSLNSAFANTTMDLRHLSIAESGTTEVVHAELNSAFARTTVVIPDDAALTVQSRQALGRLDIHTQDEQRSARGMDTSEHTVGDPDSALQILLTANTAFNRVTIYDATTYAEQMEGAPPRDGVGRDGADRSSYPVPGASTGPSASTSPMEISLEGAPR